MPNYIYAVNISPSDKKDLRGFKYMASKDRITLMVCANAVTRRPFLSLASHAASTKAALLAWYMPASQTPGWTAPCASTGSPRSLSHLSAVSWARARRPSDAPAELAKLSDSERAAKTFVDAVEAYFARVKRTQRSLHSFLQNTV